MLTVLAQNETLFYKTLRKKNKQELTPKEIVENILQNYADKTSKPNKNAQTY